MTFDPAAAVNLLQKHSRVLVTAHANPDGDALGSMCAMARLCLLLGKEVQMVCASRIPDFLDWLPLPVPLRHSYAELSGWVPELAVFLDCGTPDRAGPDGAALAAGHTLPGWKQVEILNVDHHVDNPNYGRVNFVHPEAGATAELVGSMAEYLGHALKGELGEAVYLGLCSDSGNFSFSNTSPSLFAMASRIVKNGLKIEEFTEKYENNWSMGRMQLWGHLLLNLHFFADGKIVSAVVHNETLKKFGCKASDLENFASFLRHLQSAKVSILVREKASGSKASLRSMGGANAVDVQKIAALFGGGGHKSASGVEMQLPPNQAEQAIIKELLPVVRDIF